MPVTLSESIDDLLSRPKQSTKRLDVLARYCIERFEMAGLRNVRGGRADEVGIRGLARQKDWDLAYVLANKPRLLVSLKSILENLSGSVPNRLDDLMGEAANVQQLAPEIVVGYVVIVDEKNNEFSKHHKAYWIDHFQAALSRIAIRKAPLWNQGLIEAIWLIRIDSRLAPGERVIDSEVMDASGAGFFKALVDELRRREPAVPR